jgi:hypothetical protein
MSYTEQLERDSEAARRRLAEDLDELRERITPGQLVDQLVDYVQEGSGGTFFRNLKRQTVSNPLPVTLIGAGLAWLMLGRGGNAGGPPARSWATGARMGDAAARGRETFDAARDGIGYAGTEASDFARTGRDRAADFASTARDQIGDAADSAVRSTAEFAASTSDAAARAFDTATDRASRTTAAFAEGARNASRNALGAGNDFLDFAREQPHLLAGIGIALGAALAAILPRTEAEDKLLGEASDKAHAAASDAFSRGYDKASAVGEQVLEAGKEEAERQGLTPAPAASGNRGDSGTVIAAGPPSDSSGEAAEHGAHETTPHGAA